MYSRNMKRKRDGTYTVPPGYDGSRFRREGSVNRGEYVPDSEFAPRGEPLSISGIPTNTGLRSHRSVPGTETIPENRSEDFQRDCDEERPVHEPVSEVCEEEKPRSDGIRDFFSRLGYSGISRDDLLLIGLIFLLATEKEYEGAGELALLLVLIFGVR